MTDEHLTLHRLCRYLTISNVKFYMMLKIILDSCGEFDSFKFP